MTDTTIEVRPNFGELRWELHIGGRLIGFHKRSDVCDYWAEKIARCCVVSLTVIHWSDDRESNMKQMEQYRKDKKQK